MQIGSNLHTLSSLLIKNICNLAGDRFAVTREARSTSSIYKTFSKVMSRESPNGKVAALFDSDSWKLSWHCHNFACRDNVISFTVQFSNTNDKPEDNRWQMLCL